MKKRIADRLVKALRSGDYDQTKSVLFDGFDYCCLGVLCTLKRGMKAELIPGTSPEDCHEYTFDGSGEVLPDSVMKWAGMKSLNGELEGYKSLDSMNDEGDTFATIADHIEKNYKCL